MRYYAVPCKTIPTIGKSSNPYRNSIFSHAKVMRIDMPQIIEAFNESQFILLFDNEGDAITCAESQTVDDFGDGYRQFMSPPLLQVEYERDIKADHNGISVKPSEVNLISGKMLFVGNKKVLGLPYRSVGDNTLFTTSDTLFSSEFDLRMTPVVFAIGAILGWVVDSYTVDHEKTAAATLIGAIALVLYSKWCRSRVAPNQERDTNDEIQRLSYKRC